MDLLSLLSINLNMVTIAGIVIGIFLLLYVIFRASTGFINPFNIIDKIMLIVGIVTIIMVWGYSVIENILYSRLGQVIFFGSLIIILAYFVLFYGKGRSKGTSTKRKTSSYTKVVVRK